ISSGQFISRFAIRSSWFTIAFRSPRQERASLRFRQFRSSALRQSASSAFLYASQLPRDAVKDAVDELHRFGAGKFARDFQRLINHYGRRRLWEAKKLGHAAAQDVAIHR